MHPNPNTHILFWETALEWKTWKTALDIFFGI
jgi:hypothetical protein